MQPRVTIMTGRLRASPQGQIWTFTSKSGHSQNENDTAHSVIEKAASRIPVYTTPQWETLILAAFQKHLPTVHCLNYHEVIDFKDQAYFARFSRILRGNVSDNNGNKIFWSKFMQMKVMKSQPDAIFFKFMKTNCSNL